jgi:hypothetical protein
VNLDPVPDHQDVEALEAETDPTSSPAVSIDAEEQK